jgi:hypothetical protein
MTAASGAGMALDVQAFARRHPAQSIALIECETDCAGALQALAGNLSIVNAGDNRLGSVAVVDGRRLVYTAPDKGGLMILVR